MDMYRQGIGRHLLSKCRFFCHARRENSVNKHSKVNLTSILSDFGRNRGSDTEWMARSHTTSRNHAVSTPLSRGCCCRSTSGTHQAETASMAERAESSQGASTLEIPGGGTKSMSTFDRGDQMQSVEDSREIASSIRNSGSTVLERLLLDGGRMTSIAQSAWAQFVEEGHTVVDATCGNGYDTKWLAERIGPAGHLVAFDIQEDAIRSTSAVLEDEVDPERLPNVRFIHGCHSTMQEHVHAAHFVCFNLGFLPGGDRSVISRPATTLAAIKAAMSILEPQGIISVLAYVGHPGGLEEYTAVQEMALQVHPQEFSIFEQRILNRPNAPVLIIFWRRPQD